VKPLYTDPQFGQIWECPDFFSVEPYNVLKASATSYGDVWVVGKYDDTNQDFSTVGLMVPVCYGQCYASKSFHDPLKNRQILWTWVSEEDNGGPARGWQGCQSLPAVIGIDTTYLIPTTTPAPVSYLLPINVTILGITTSPKYISTIY